MTHFKRCDDHVHAIALDDYIVSIQPPASAHGPDTLGSLVTDADVTRPVNDVIRYQLREHFGLGDLQIYYVCPRARPDTPATFPREFERDWRFLFASLLRHGNPVLPGTDPASALARTIHITTPPRLPPHALTRLPSPGHGCHEPEMASRFPISAGSSTPPPDPLGLEFHPLPDVEPTASPDCPLQPAALVGAWQSFAPLVSLADIAIRVRSPNDQDGFDLAACVPADRVVCELNDPYRVSGEATVVVDAAVGTGQQQDPSLDDPVEDGDEIPIAPVGQVLVDELLDRICELFALSRDDLAKPGFKFVLPGMKVGLELYQLWAVV
ncbi:hypothetical protein C8A01DRAFT_42314 [Parachaetomium inaequale]|uniref:Uncharacterized protein n=1 Tax=Parachaetomium inaequale TaxID=2588326 RepID=A0AAN6P3R3_9PEZI|nr:hypothetical protein C8A01DRAFT_42314 [Parachaetomium inaequale]